MIRRGELEAGRPLPTVRELTALYAVGPSSVREAMRMLESRGLLTAGAGRTFVVASARNPLEASFRELLSLETVTIGDLYDLRRMLEIEAAALAAVRRNDNDLEALARAFEGQVEATEHLGADGAIERGVRADVDFHLAIARASGNAPAVSIMEVLRDLLRQALERVAAIPAAYVETLAHHRAILAAIRAGDSEAARRAMREHLDAVQEQASPVLDSPVDGLLARRTNA